MYENIYRDYNIPLFFPGEPTAPIVSLSLHYYGNVWLVSLEHEQDIGRNTQILHGVWNTDQLNVLHVNDDWPPQWYTKTGQPLPVTDYVYGIIEQQINDIIDHNFDLPYIIDIAQSRMYTRSLERLDHPSHIYCTINIIVLDLLDTALIQIEGHDNFACVYQNGKVKSINLPKHPHIREEIERIINGNYDLMDRDVINNLRYLPAQFR